MTTFKTDLKNYRIVVDYEDFIENFDFYTGCRVAFKNISRDVDLTKVSTLRLDDWEIDYLLGKKSKKEVLDDDVCRSEDDFTTLDQYKKDYNIVGLEYGEHSQVAIHTGGTDGVLFAEKGESMDDIEELVKMLTSWFNGWIYRVGIFEAKKFYSENGDGECIIHWEYVDGQCGFFSFEDALNSLPEYVGKVKMDSQDDGPFNEFEFCTC